MRAFSVVCVTALVACGGPSLKGTCDQVARPGTWHVTATLRAGRDGTPYGFPGTCPTIALTVNVPVSASDVEASALYQPASSEPGSTDLCAIFYRQGAPSTGGRTACGGEFEAGNATRTRLAECFFQVGPANAYGDFTYFCGYTAQWDRVD